MSRYRTRLFRGLRRHFHPLGRCRALVELAKEVYNEQNGEEVEVATLHASLECSTIKTLKPDLDMISIGPDLSDAHTSDKTLYLDSIPKVWHLLEGVLSRVS